MHVLLVADGRSPTTRSFLSMLQEQGIRVSMASTYACTPAEGLAGFTVFPIAFSRFAGNDTGVRQSGGSRSGAHILKSLLRPLLYPLRYHLGPLSTRWYRKPFLDFIEQTRPDLVHALRIPFEGMLAVHTPAPIPMVVSTWGNDLTLHAWRAPPMRRWTRRVLQRADGLYADTRREIRLGHAWGLGEEKPVLVGPGSGGLRLNRIDRPRPELLAGLPDRMLAAKTLVVNPRGFRPGSVRNDTFFQAIPLVLAQRPDACFACSAMQGHPQALAWVQRLGIEESTFLLPHLPQETLWEVFRRASVSVSVSQHDGTPNSLLEAMACGCFPVVGDIESLREWIRDGENGLLVDPGDAQALAAALLRAMEDDVLRKEAARQNREMVEKRADIRMIRPQILELYEGITRQ